MMEPEDIKRQEERHKFLMDLLQKEFPDADIEEFRAEFKMDPLRIRVEINTPKKTAIIFEPSSPLMIDNKNRFEDIFALAVIETKKIFSDPPQKEKILQGVIKLLSHRIKFVPRK